MNILDNDLVRKYFYGPDPIGYGAHDRIADMAFRVLQAMQEPIKKGDKVLWIQAKDIVEIELGYDDLTWVHNSLLRLPDRFQEKKCSCKCHDDGCNCVLLHPEQHSKPSDSIIKNGPTH